MNLSVFIARRYLRSVILLVLLLTPIVLINAFLLFMLGISISSVLLLYEQSSFIIWSEVWKAAIWLGLLIIAACIQLIPALRKRVFKATPLQRLFKSLNVINIISYITVIALTTATAAFICILSVFNGFEGLVVDLYDSFYPDLKVQPVAGKVFIPAAGGLHKIASIEGVKGVSSVLQENALLGFHDRQSISIIKGVDDQYVKVTGMDSSVIYSDTFLLQQGNIPYAIIGAGIDRELQPSMKDQLNRLSVFVPRRGSKRISFIPTPADEIKSRQIMVWDIFAIQDDFDNNYIFVPLSFLQELLDYDNEISALEVGVEPDADKQRIRDEIAAIMGEDYEVLTKYQQNAFLFNVMEVERLVVYLVLTFVLLIVAFNMIGSMSMQVIEKKKDIGILKTMGATGGFIKKVFLYQGILQAIISIVIGFSVAFLIIIIQQQFGLIKLNGGQSFLVQYYPVEMKLVDFVVVSIIVFTITTLAAFLPAIRAARQPHLLPT